MKDTESEDELYFSPPNQLDIDQSRLSPSLPPSTSINMNKNYDDIILKTILQKPSPEIIEINSNSPDIPYQPIVHVKDENEISTDTNNNNSTINMAQATQQMLNQEYPQPIILLKRICIDNYSQ